ncbi:UNKNOWN [Stylonychia lemnae]|uniref:DUF4200 domain-containing protein n=1 Tax=Stylonychia lemnae TaxID=5949 RepID=A0A078B6U4_STYLE|nr:UNKNOWN [Stylonychia lemnae]|eukprot:CDW89906.1 UNKNOWN [Stylonychia lemnae]
MVDTSFDAHEKLDKNNISIQLPSIQKRTRKQHDSPDFQFQTLGLAGKYQSRYGEKEDDKQKGGNTSYLNPFSVKKTTEQLLIQRELERMSRFKRETSLSQQMNNQDNNSLVNLSAIKKRFGTVNHSIDMKRSHNNTTIEPIANSYLTSIDPLNDKSVDRTQQVIIRDLPPTLRYLSKNAFSSTSGSPRETSKEIVGSIRSIFYAQMSIEAKREETLKLKEYIIMEREKLEEARRVFQEDQDKFQKYMAEMEQQAEKARENTDNSQKEKGDFADYLERLQDEIHRFDKEITQVDDDLKQSALFKEFIDLVKGQRKFKAKPDDKKMNSTGRFNKSGADNFFITEEAQKIMNLENLSQQDSNIDPNGVDLSKNEFLEIIQSLEDANIFLLDNIQNEEQDLERLEKRAEIKYTKQQKILDEIQENINTYQLKIADKMVKKNSIKTYIKSFNQADQGNNTISRKRSKSDLHSDKMSDFKSQMTSLKSIISRLYQKVRQSGPARDTDDDVVVQLGEIERKLALYIERRDLIFFSGEAAPDQVKQLQEVEKIVDKDRKQIRYEKKKQNEKEMIKEKQLKVEKRMERSSKQTSNSHQARIMMTRSNKPEVVRVFEDPNKNITQEELDYIKYVDSIGKSQVTQSALQKQIQSNNKAQLREEQQRQQQKSLQTEQTE